MLYRYPACFYEERGGGYSVIFPDLDHLATQGDDPDDAMNMAADCLAGYIFTAKQEGERLPAPSDIKDIDVNSEYKGYKTASVKMVSVDAEKYWESHFQEGMSMPKVNVRIDKELFDAAAAEGRSKSRSAAQQIDFWVRVGRSALANPDLEAVEIAGILEARDLPGEPFVPEGGKADPFYSEENMQRLRRSVREMEETGGKIHVPCADSLTEEELRSLLEEGLNDVKSGKTVEFTEAMKEIRAALEEKRKGNR